SRTLALQASHVAYILPSPTKNPASKEAGYSIAPPLRLASRHHTPKSLCDRSEDSATPQAGLGFDSRAPFAAGSDAALSEKLIWQSSCSCKNQNHTGRVPVLLRAFITCSGVLILVPQPP